MADGGVEDSSIGLDGKLVACLVRMRVTAVCLIDIGRIWHV